MVTLHNEGPHGKFFLGSKKKIPFPNFGVHFLDYLKNINVTKLHLSRSIECLKSCNSDMDLCKILSRISIHDGYGCCFAWT